MHSLGDKYPTRPVFEPSITEFRAQTGSNKPLEPFPAKTLRWTNVDLISNHCLRPLPNNACVLFTGQAVDDTLSFRAFNMFNIVQCPIIFRFRYCNFLSVAENDCSISAGSNQFITGNSGNSINPCPQSDCAFSVDHRWLVRMSGDTLIKSHVLSESTRDRAVILTGLVTPQCLTHIT